MCHARPECPFPPHCHRSNRPRAVSETRSLPKAGNEDLGGRESSDIWQIESKLALPGKVRNAAPLNTHPLGAKSGTQEVRVRLMTSTAFGLEGKIRVWFCRAPCAALTPVTGAWGFGGGRRGRGCCAPRAEATMKRGGFRGAQNCCPQHRVSN